MIQAWKKRQPAVLRAKETTSHGRELVIVRAPGLGPTPVGGAAGGGGRAPHPTPAPTVAELLILLAVATISDDDADPCAGRWIHT
jgi:hypothetical protein